MLFGIYLLPAAQDTGVKSIAAAVTLDSVVVVAQKAGFSVTDFISLVQSDKSFYRAFRNLRSMSYRFHVDMAFQDKKDNEKAAYAASQVQWYEAPCRWMETEWSRGEGNFFKGRKQPRFKYYTAKLYERLFCTEGKVCESPGSGPDTKADQGRDQMEDHVDQLKKLIFTPGEKANVPFIGKKTAIFSDRMLDYYQFNISSDMYAGTECYVFTASVKPGFADLPAKTVIKYLATWFRKSDFQVMGRNYRLSHRTILYNFDVEMDIQLIRTDGAYYPDSIRYDGFWNIPFKKFEKGNFTVRFTDFGIQKTD